MRPGLNIPRRARIACVTVLGVLVGVLIGSQPIAGHSAGIASLVPDGLFTDLVKIDRRLSKLIDGLQKDGWQRDDLFAVRAIEDAKLRMVD